METAEAKSKTYHDLIDEADSMTLRDVMDTGIAYPYVHSDHPVSYALERMRESGVDVLPVVSRAGIHEISGVIGLREILEAYGVPGSQIFSRSTQDSARESAQA
jgi:CBS domain-containing protein